VSRIPSAEIDDLLARTNCVREAEKYVRLRGSGAKKIGPCPICSSDTQSKSATRFEVTPAKWVCAVCADGGNAIALVMKASRIGFREAVERLGGTRAVDPEEAARLEAARKAKAEAAARENAAYRERERERCYEIYTKMALPRVYLLDAYFKHRDLLIPPYIPLRFIENFPFFHGKDERGDARVIHRGPVMLAPVLDAAGKFSALHFTWLDLAQPKGKALIVDPDTGEILPAKKVRGSKAGGYIPINGAKAAGQRMIAGEGIETVCGFYTSMVRAGHSTEGYVFRAAVDLGNLAGRAIDTVPHPTAKTATGRPQRVPGDIPEMESPAMPVLDDTEELILLGDGDSDPFTTRLAMTRAARRHARPGRTVRTPFAPPGEDFDSWRRA